MPILSRTALVTGASSGVGLACCKKLQQLGYEVVGVARRAGEFITERGDLHAAGFRAKLLEAYTPDVFINNAGIVALDAQQVFNLNVTAAAELMHGFYAKMPPNSAIINIGSISANLSGWQDMKRFIAYYKASKSALKVLSNDLTYHRARQVRVTSIEPDKIDTPMLKRPVLDKTGYTDAFDMRKHFCPLTAEYVAEVVAWVLAQPPWVVIKSLEISNHNRNGLDEPVR